MDKLTIDLKQAARYNLYLTLFLLIATGLPYYLLYTEQFTVAHFSATLQKLGKKYSYFLGLIPFLVLIIGILAHEFIHGITWALFSKNGYRSIKYGIMKESSTPYCHCTEPLKVKHYIAGAMMPAVLLGVIPTGISLSTGNFYLFVFGLFFTTAAIGDFMIVYLLRNEKRNSEVIDHPTEAGCYINRI